MLKLTPEQFQGIQARIKEQGRLVKGKASGTTTKVEPAGSRSKRINSGEAWLAFHLGEAKLEGWEREYHFHEERRWEVGAGRVWLLPAWFHSRRVEWIDGAPVAGGGEGAGAGD